MSWFHDMPPLFAAKKPIVCSSCQQVMDAEDPYRSAATDSKRWPPSERRPILRRLGRNPNRFASFFKRMYGKHSKALSIVLAAFVAFSLVAIKYPIVAARFGEGIFVCMVGALGLGIGVFGVWLAGIGPFRIGWHVGKHFTFWDEPGDAQRFNVCGPIPWLFGLFLLGIPVGAYYLGTVLLSCLH